MPDLHGLDLEKGERVIVAANGHLLGQTAVVLSQMESNHYLIEFDQKRSGERIAVMSGRQLASLGAP